ncbi:hypothetical protein GY14_10075 [Delftia tsuruhatensis]|nr:hypothetical protein GY14_10075 [Delftia tsuruhatensis]
MMLWGLYSKRLCHLCQEFSQVGTLVVKRQELLTGHGRIKSASRNQLDQIIHSDQWQPVLCATRHCSQFSLRQIAYQIHQWLAARYMSRAAMTTDRCGVHDGHFPSLGSHELQGREMRLQFAPLVSADTPIDGRPMSPFRMAGINSDALQMFIVLQHIAADHHQPAILLRCQKRHALCTFHIHCTRMLH